MNPANNGPASLPLRDIHLPENVSWWPPAPGWWLLLLLLVGLLLLLRWWLRQRRIKARSAGAQAQMEIRRLRNEYAQHQDKSLLARELSELLRRMSISVFPRQEVASITGEEWLSFLDEQSEDKRFTQGEGRSLIEAPYLAKPDYDEEILLTLVESWLVAVTKKQKEAG